MQYENILVEIHGKVGLITLNRPAALNALNDKLMDERWVWRCNPSMAMTISAA